MEDYPCACIERKINGRDITILGVHHTESFLFRYYEFLSSKIHSADAVVLEQVVGAEFFQDRGFFGRLGSMAGFKPVYVIDPVNPISFKIDDFAGPAGILLMLSPFIIRSTNDIKKRLTPKKSNKVAEKQGCTRRDFLKCLFGYGVAVGAGASMLCGSHLGIIAKQLISENLLMRYGIDDALSYGLLDFRNIIIADGIEKLTKLEDGKMVAVHGDAHSDPIDFYLMNPTARKKRLAYFPYEQIAEARIKKFVYKRKGWTLEEIVPF